MLSDRELKPYHVYEETSAEFEIRGGHPLPRQSLAKHDIYFSPRPKT